MERVGRVLFRGDPIFTRGLYEGTDFREFFFRAGSRLPFESSSFGFVYSEHFLEHLTRSLVLELLRECHRILKVGGVLRTVIPDANIAHVRAPEAIGHPRHRPGGHPKKHLVRYTWKLLSSVIEEGGFRAIPLDYCTAEGDHIQRTPPSGSW